MGNTVWHVTGIDKAFCKTFSDRAGRNAAGSKGKPIPEYWSVSANQNAALSPLYQLQLMRISEDQHWPLTLTD